MFIDPHVHLRDFQQSDKETIRHGLEVARDCGVDAVFDMPNTNPPVISEETVAARLKLAEAANCPEVFYGLYLGMTTDPEQIKKMVELYRKYPKVVGFKLYAGHSVGTLGVVSEAEQLTVYQTLASVGYDGVLAVHCEKESEISNSLWDPQNPESHCLARPPKAEVESVKDQVRLAQTAGFAGKLHVVHVSVPASVEIINQAKKNGLDISCAVCPHHLVFDQRQLSGPDGLYWKMNPPLRSSDASNKMLEYLKKGLIDWLETDHAPHTRQEKMNPPYMSGIPGLSWWPLYAAFLNDHGFTEKQIESLTFSNALSKFGLTIQKKSLIFKDHRQDYGFDPYAELAAKIDWPQK